MAKAEAARADGIEAVAIVTPNHLHAPVAEAFLKAGIHVICDKPLTTSAGDARKLRQLGDASTIGCSRVTLQLHRLSDGPPGARRWCSDGELGEIRVVQVEYPQDWLTEPLEASGQKQAAWRTDPARSGAGGCIGDIGTHAFQLAGFVTGLRGQRAVRRAQHLRRRPPPRRQRRRCCCASPNGARGTLWASQVAPGNENNLRLRVYGSRGGLEWRQEQPNQLAWSPFGEPTQTIARAGRRGRVPRRRG